MEPLLSRSCLSEPDWLLENDYDSPCSTLSASPLAGSLGASPIGKGKLMESANPDRSSFNVEEHMLNAEQREALFRLCDTDNDGLVDVAALQRTLVLMGVLLTDEEIQENLGGQSAGAPAGEVAMDRELFDRAVTRGLLKNAERMLQSDEVNLRCISYSSLWIRDRMCSASDQASDLYQVEDGQGVKWIDLGRNDLALRRLGISYKLHPDAVTDCLEHKSSAKVETYSNHVHIVLPVLILCVRSSESAPRRMWRLCGRRPRQKHPEDWAVVADQVDIFLCGHSSRSPQPGDRADALNTVITVRPSCGFSAEMGELYDGLFETLNLPYTRIRSGNSAHLLHAIVAKLVLALGNAVAKFSSLLNEHQVNLHGRSGGDGDANNLLMIDQDLLHVHKLQHKLLKLQLVLRGVPGTLKSVLTDPLLKLPPELRVIFQRVANHAKEIAQEVKNLSALALLLEEEYESRRDYIHSEANTLLAIMVTICLPLQAVSGLWGVNVTVPFQTGGDDGNYTPFILIAAASLAVALLCIIIFRIKGWW